MSPYEQYIKAIVDSTPVEHREKKCLQMMVAAMIPKQQRPGTLHGRIVCLGFTLGGLYTASKDYRYMFLAQWLTTASDAEINEIFKGSENGN